MDDSEKIDCGTGSITEDECTSKGCCWVEHTDDNDGAVPWCFYQAGDVSSCFTLADSAAAPFSDDEISTMRGYFLDNVNIEGKGTRDSLDLVVLLGPFPSSPGTLG